MTAIPENVQKVIDYAALVISRKAENDFHCDMAMGVHGLGIKSPIEQLFWGAFHAVASAQGLKVVNAGSRSWPGVHIKPQVSLGQYRVDFVVAYIAEDGVRAPRTVVVELDGHAFHDKDKAQRSYEKQRDRDLIALGYAPLHFTGSDVTANPFGVAFEVLEFVAGRGLMYGDPKDPLDLRGDELIAPTLGAGMLDAL